MTLTRYLSRRMGGTIAAVLVVLLVLATTLDLIENAPEVISRYGLGALARYAMLRAPLLLAFIAPLGILAGAVMGFLTLAARNEIVVLRASGVSTLGLVARLVPLAFILGGLNGALVSVVAPSAERALLTGMPELLGWKQSIEDIWLRDIQTVVHIGRASRDGSELNGVSIFELSPEGPLESRLDAARASFTGDAWLLQEVRRQSYGAPAQVLPELQWKGRMRPSSILGAAYRPDLIDIREARKVIKGVLPMERAAPFYELKIWQDAAAFLVPLVMLILSGQASFGISRGGGRPGLVALALAMGGAFVVFDGIFSSLGEIGALRPAVAAFFAPVVFSMLGMWATLIIEE